MREPGVEPGPIAWKATMLAATPLTLSYYQALFYSIYMFLLHLRTSQECHFMLALSSNAIRCKVQTAKIIKENLIIPEKLQTNMIVSSVIVLRNYTI